MSVFKQNIMLAALAMGYRDPDVCFIPEEQLHMGEFQQTGSGLYSFGQGTPYNMTDAAAFESENVVQVLMNGNAKSQPELTALIDGVRVEVELDGVDENDIKRALEGSYIHFKGEGGRECWIPLAPYVSSPAKAQLDGSAGPTERYNIARGGFGPLPEPIIVQFSLDTFELVNVGLAPTNSIPARVIFDGVVARDTSLGNYTAGARFKGVPDVVKGRQQLSLYRQLRMGSTAFPGV